MEFKNRLGYTVVFIFLITFIFVIILAYINGMSRSTIERNETLFYAKAVLDAFQISYDNKDQALVLFNELEVTYYDDDEQYQMVDQKRADSLIKEGKRITTLFIHWNKEDNRKQYASIFSGPGLWGEIVGVLAVNEELSHTVGIQIISMSETPGLGARIAEPWFQEQLKKQKIVNQSLLVKAGSSRTAKDKGVIDGISGATFTSNAMESILTKTIQKMNSILRRT